MVPELTKVTVCGPRRRLDVAVPGDVPLAELLPALLRQAGDDLADAGQQHEGWVLRRPDGGQIPLGRGLADAGVRDGEVLHLAPARAAWPELEYDDVVEAVASSAARATWVWRPETTRAAWLAATSLALAAGLAALPRSGPAGLLGGLASLSTAALLVLAGAITSRAFARRTAAAVLAGFALPYAFLGAAACFAAPADQAASGGGTGPARLLVASAATLLTAVLAALGVGRPHAVFVAGASVAAAGIAAGSAALFATPSGAAAALLAALVIAVAGAPAAAVRLGKLPLLTAVSRPELAVVRAGVERGEQVLAGLLAGVVMPAAVASFVLVRSGGTAGRLLVATAAGVLALRGRVFVAVPHRLPLLVTGAAGYALLVLVPHWPAGVRLAIAAALVIAALAAVAIGGSDERRGPSPYLARAADVLDAAGVVAVIPLACAVLGLYGRMRALA